MAEVCVSAVSVLDCSVDTCVMGTIVFAELPAALRPVVWRSFTTRVRWVARA